MNRSGLIIFLLLFFQSTCFSFGSDEKMMKIRPANLKVIDKTTKQPLENIKVYYALRSFKRKRKMLFFWPRPEPKDEKKYEIIKQYSTDKDGMVHFEKRHISLEKSENIYDESIFINLDIGQKWSRKLFIKTIEDKINFMNLNRISLEAEYYMNPTEEYRGFVILSFPWELEKLHGKGSAGDILCSPNSFQKESENFVVKLERRLNMRNPGQP